MQRGGQTGQPDLDREHELSLELSACERAADPDDPSDAPAGCHRRSSARRRALRASGCTTTCIAVLDEELRDEAEEASEELIEAYASIQHSVDRYRAIQQRVWQLLQITVAGEHAQALGADAPACPRAAAAAPE